MKQTTILFILSLIFKLSILSQGDDAVWKYANTTTEAEIKLINTDSVGNTYLAGTFSSNDFSYQGKTVSGIVGPQTINSFFLKLDATGRLVWLHSIHGDLIGSQVSPEKIKLNDGGEATVLLYGDYGIEYMLDGLALEGDSAQRIPLIAKVSKTGRIHWAHSLKAERDFSPQIRLTDAFLDNEGVCFAVGYFRGINARFGSEFIEGPPDDFISFMARINTDGSIGWFRPSRYNPDEEGGNLMVKVIHNGPDNLLYVAGSYNGSRSYIFGEDTIQYSDNIDAFLAQITKDGNDNWAVQISGDYMDYAEELTVLNNNDVVLMGLHNSVDLPIDGELFSSPDNSYNIFLVQYSEDKEIKSAKEIPTSKPIYYTVGKNAYMAKDLFGNILVSSEFNSTNLFSDEHSLLNSDPGTSDIFFAKFAGNSLNTLWTKQAFGIGDNYLESAYIDRIGNIYIGGTSYTTLSLAGNPIASTNSDGIPYIGKVTTNGNFGYSYFQDNTADAAVMIRSVAGDPHGNTYVGGAFNGTSAILDNHPLNEAGGRGVFFGKYGQVKNVVGSLKNEAGEAVGNAYAKIYGFTQYQKSPLGDSVMISEDGNFIFHDIPYGNYIIQVEPLGATKESYITTYFPSAEYWEFADRIRIRSKTEVPMLEITMLPPSEFAGETELSGNFSQEDAELKKLHKPGEKSKPKTKANVILAGNKKNKSTYEVVATSETDEDGNFAFYSIENGTYYLWVDEPGLPCEPIHIVEVSGESFISNINYLETEEVIVPVDLPIYSAIQNKPQESGIHVYPNPASSTLTFDLPNSGKAIVDIYDSKGMHIEHYLMDQQVSTLSLSKYTSGNYFLRIITEENIVFEKITINR